MVVERPILFSGTMVRAILEGRKTMTRRVCKLEGLDEPGLYENRDGDLVDPLVYCPHGSRGDRLWVRETFAKIFNQDGCLDEDRTCPCDGCHIEYRSDSQTKYPGEWDDDMGDDPDCPKWKPSIFMPRLVSRITLEITGVRVERLQDIGAEDAIAEGIIEPKQCAEYRFGMHRAVAEFADLWDSINAIRGYGWDKNPWVWVISFKRLPQPVEKHQ